MEARHRREYAVDKCRAAARDHEQDVAPVAPTAKAKVVVIGNSGVGKTSIIYRQSVKGEELPTFNATIGATFVFCDAKVEEGDLQLQIWDTAGQERYRCMVPMYLRNAAAAIVVYDISSRDSFVDIDKWLIDLRRSNPTADPLLVLVGNKADLDAKRQVKTSEGEAKARSIKARFYEISAYQHDAIEGILMQLASDLQKKPVADPPEEVEKVSIRKLMSSYEEPVEKATKCCSAL